jgi:hypothetical protein
VNISLPIIVISAVDFYFLRTGPRSGTLRGVQRPVEIGDDAKNYAQEEV